MTPNPSTLRLALMAIAFSATQASVAIHAQEADVQVVLQNGRSVPLSSLGLQGDSLVVTAAAGIFTAGQKIPLQAVDHVYGVMPAEINQATALLLIEKPKEAKALLEPIIVKHRVTAKFSGNFWLEAARMLLLAHALNGDATSATAIGKEISEATPEQGNDPFVSLGKALLMPALTTKVEDRELVLRDLMTDANLTEICALASYFRGNLFLKDKRKPEALEAFLTVPCLYPSGGLIVNAAAEMQAADLLTELTRPEESKLLLQSALREADGTALATEINKRLESLK
ncbi:MAG: hypothetical protein H8M99_10210 [Gloeobacteraceae cyanobacterium ES-bin-144]|nr:hypothetical protein [Verrucomicrobiales bacterium]